MIDEERGQDCGTVLNVFLKVKYSSWIKFLQIPFLLQSVCTFEGVAFSDFLSADVFKVDIWEIFNFEILMQYYQARPANNWQRGSLSDNLELKNWVSLSCLKH